MREKHTYGYIPQLDGLRAFAATLVLIQHSAIDFTGVRAFGLIEHYGMAGIQLFFVLSGFLITGILLDSKDDPRYFRNFFMRRGLRIYPLYFASVAMIMLGAAMMNRFAGVQWWIYLLYLSNLITSSGKPPAALGTMWSLAVEEQFYLVWPFFVRKMSARTIERVAVVVIVGVMVLRFLNVLAFHNTLLQLDALAAGALIACRRNQLSLVKRWAFVAACTFPLGLALPHGTLNEISREFQVLSAAGILIALLTATEGSWVVKVFGNAGMRYVGRVSYGIYVLHSHVFNAFRATALHDRVVRSNSLWQASLCLLVEYAAVLVIASISFYAFERPFLRLKRYFELSASGQGKGDLVLRASSESPELSAQKA